MSTDPNSHSLPERPNLRHLKNQAKDLHRAGAAASLTGAQFQLAREYGFSSWQNLKAHVESLCETGRLKDAIDANDLVHIKEMMRQNPELHRAPLGYNNNGPLTWVAECRGVQPTVDRLEIAQWMIDNGSDVHQGGDGPLMRAALQDDRIPMMELLVENGANVNALWNGHYPIVFAACETYACGSLKWLVEHGANLNSEDAKRHCVQMLISTYWRDPVGKSGCLDVLTKAGFQFPNTAPMAIHLGRLDLLEACLSHEPELLSRHWPESEFFPFGIKPGSGLHGVTLDGALLLHMAVEYQELEIARWLIEQGADVNATTKVDVDGFGAHTPLFHTIVTPARKTDALARLLLQNGADPNIRATFRKLRGASGDVENEPPAEYHNASVLDFAKQFERPGYLNEAALDVIKHYAVDGPA